MVKAVQWEHFKLIDMGEVDWRIQDVTTGYIYVSKKLFDNAHEGVLFFHGWVYDGERYFEDYALTPTALKNAIKQYKEQGYVQRLKGEVISG